jgi:hypothetical protein
MGTLLIGMMIVAVSAVGFGLALFGRRPVPQPATESGTAHLAPSPSGSGVSAGASKLRTLAPGGGRLAHLPVRRPRADDVTLSGWVRLRSALLLLLTVAGLAALIGGVLSIILVGLVLIVT